MNNNLEIKISGKRGAGKAKLASRIICSLANPSHIFAIGENYADCMAYLSDNLLRNHFIAYKYERNWAYETARLIENMIETTTFPSSFKPENTYYLVIEMFEVAWQEYLVNQLLEEISCANIIPIFISVMPDEIN